MARSTTLIARLLDAGVTREGLPFLVMELVDGLPVDQYVKQVRPSTKELIQLFRKICAPSRTLIAI